MKLLAIALAFLVLLGGAFVGLGYAGVVQIPGISPKKARQAPKPAADPAASEAAKPAAQAAKPQPEPKPAPPQPAPAPKPREERRTDGTERVAKLWSEIDSETLAKILEKWPDGDALPVLAKMDDKKLAALLAVLPPDRAASLSRGIKTLEKGGR